jgi:hypothetical protein
VVNSGKKHPSFLKWHAGVMALLMLFTCTGFAPYEADNNPHTKALFIYNFVKYIHWPQDKLGDIFTIGVVGKTQTMSELQSVCENKTANNRPIQIIQIDQTEKVDECDAIFITRRQSFLLEDVLDIIDNKGTLIVTEAKGLLKNGSAINLVIQGKKEAFEVNQSALIRQGLKIPDNLLVLAVNVDVGPRF